MRHTMAVVTLLAAALAACSTSATAPKLLGRDPYVTVQLDYQFDTSRLKTRYLVVYVGVNGTITRQGTMLPTDPQPISMCVRFGGILEDSVNAVEIRAVGDTIQPNRPDSVLLRAATRTDTTWTGLVRLSTGVFNASVPNDTSRGPTTDRPIMWRWRWTDSLVALTHDTTGVCRHF